MSAYYPKDREVNKMKSVFKSKTLWVNFVSLVIIFLQAINSLSLPISVETQALILALLNFLLRFKTDQKVGL